MINIAIIGAGYWGSKIVEVLKKNPNIGIVQVIDIKNGQTINDIYSDITTAVIATPVWDHLHIAIDLVNRGFDLYIEKPMCETAAEVQMLSNYAPRQVLMVGHIFLYHPALEIIKSNISRIGKIKHVDSQRLNWGIYQTKTTPLLSLLPHDISILNELFTDITVTGASHRNFTDNIVPDWVSFNLTMGDVTATVTGSWYWPERVRKLTIIGDTGSIVWDDAANQVHVFEGKVNEHRLSVLDEEIYIPDLSVSPLEKELDHFVACVVTRQRPKTDVRNALEVAKILDAVKEHLSWAR
jgi:UDP-2-acetamido-3-amino-2,3-dideoxy-glucuronate N-acetyltransferase